MKNNIFTVKVKYIREDGSEAVLTTLASSERELLKNFKAIMKTIKL